ncbi:MAG TPA: M28 family peptidase [Ktedonobacterales bacterium]|nr:M28 family peptidase [Ktedonobacterales bacterium]
MRTTRPLACLALSLLVLALALGACDLTASRTPTPASSATASAPPIPAVDADYLYDQFATLSTRFIHREAGFDTDLPPNQNGHDEFAAYWTQEMLRDLDGFGAQARQDTFAIPGWRGRPAVRPAANVEVSVPGLTHPDQAVIIGCHYDGEAQSTESAFDDTSGCAIELAVARAMGQYWRAQHHFPARTLRFVMFDAEESGIYGSWHYVNQTINGDLGQITAMINEEQNGIAYPLRFLGKAANQLLPFYVDAAPSASNGAYPAQNALPATLREAIQRFRNRLSPAVSAAFNDLRIDGYTSLDYRGSNGQTQAQPVFTPDQLGNVVVQDDALGNSDEIAFTLTGIPCATFTGNYTYYFRREPQPAWSYPYDQPEDTLALMNVYASGHTAKSPALALALALPAMLTVELLRQPETLGDVAADNNPLVALADIGPTLAGKPIALDASGSFDPDRGGGGDLTYAWDFGDGAKSDGATASHIYTAPGTYSITLTVRSPSGTRQVHKTLTVAASAPYYPNPHDGNPPSGYPAPNSNVHLPALEP